jgi:hypothetical protein
LVKKVSSLDTSYITPLARFTQAVYRSVDEKDQTTAMLSTLRDGWIEAFGVMPLPENDIYFNDIFQTIKYGLLCKSSENKEVSKKLDACLIMLQDRKKGLSMLPQRTRQLFDYEAESNLGKLVLNFTQNLLKEASMPAKKISPEEQKENQLAAMVEKSTAKKKADTPKPAKAAPAKPAKSPAKKEVKVSMGIRICQILLERKFTDESILNILKKEFPGNKANYRTISIERFRINHGERIPSGIPKPAKEVIKIESGKKA